MVAKIGSFFGCYCEDSDCLLCFSRVFRFNSTGFIQVQHGQIAKVINPGECFFPELVEHGESFFHESGLFKLLFASQCVHDAGEVVLCG
ncbi:MAG: hypothetical protein ABIG61_09715 [Planctomycetota bacterium]